MALVALRLVYLAAGAAVGFVIGTAVLVSRAEDVDGHGRREGPILSAETVAVAVASAVNPIDLAGAVNTSGYTPRVYLCLVGEGPCPEPPIPPTVGAVGRADCIIGKESGGLDIPNRQGSGANGPGQYFVGTWARHTALFRASTGYGGTLSLHRLQDVRRVMAFMLSAYPGSRSEWSVGGC